MALPKFWQISQPYLNQGAADDQHITTGPPEFQSFLRPWEVVAAGGQGDISYPSVTYGKFMSWEKKNFTTWALLNPLCTYKKYGICSISDATSWKGVLSTLNFTNVLSMILIFVS